MKSTRTRFSAPETLPHHHQSMRYLLVRLLQHLHQIVYVPGIVRRDEGVGCSLPRGASCPSDTMDVVFRCVRVVEVYHVRDVGDV